MADKTCIEWTDASWNAVVGCSIVSPGCTNCYAMGQAARIIRCAEGLSRETHYAGTVREVKGKPVWTGKLALAPDRTLLQPLRWRQGRKIFVNSMGDLFHEDMPEAWIDRVFAVMALSPQHTYQILTKRAARMRAYVSDPATPGRVYDIVCDLSLEQAANVILLARPEHAAHAPLGRKVLLGRWPLPNVWKGVSAEDQARADERVPELQATPAAVRFVSAEPLLGPIDFQPWIELCHAGRDGECSAASCPQLRDREPARSGRHCRIDNWGDPYDGEQPPPQLDWIIVGGESGPGARPMHPDWVRSIREQCAAAGTAFFFKQWGEWAPGESCSGRQTRTEDAAKFYGEEWDSPGWHYERISPRVSEELHRDDEPHVWRVGKGRAGRLLDGVEHSAMPTVRS